MAPDGQSIAVHDARFMHGKGQVFFASIPCTKQTLKTKETAGIDDKLRLATALWDHVEAMNSRRKGCQSASQTDFPVTVECGLLGKPHLRRGGERGPAISFSTHAGEVWAALSGNATDIGIDVAGSEEFQSEYPFLRVFHSEEIQHAQWLTNGSLEEAAALLWSIKEAVVKALGCAFHLVDPRHISVSPSVEGGVSGCSFPVGLSGKARERFPRIASQPLWVRSLPQQKKWLSIAQVNREPTGHE